MRKLRYVPQPRTLVSITNRTIQGRYLLRPGPSFDDIFLGILGRAQRQHEIPHPRFGCHAPVLSFLIG